MTVFHNNTLKYYGTNILIEFSHPDMYTSSHSARTLTNSETNKKKCITMHITSIEIFNNYLEGHGLMNWNSEISI